MHLLKSKGGSSLITAITVAVIINIAIASVFFSSRNTIKNTDIAHEKTSTSYIAEAGKNALYAKVSRRNHTPKTDIQEVVLSEIPFKNGMYTVSCKTNITMDSLWVRSIATEGGFNSTIETIASLTPDVTINFPPVRGAVTALSRITIAGNIEIDGQDYDTSNVRIGAGTHGVSTCDSINLKENAITGGNGIVPVGKNGFNSIKTTICEEQAYNDGRFASPEAFLGLPAGALEKYKVQNYSPPFSGLIYITDSIVGPMNLEESSGILIVHNKNFSSELHITGGTFKGLIITDRIDKIGGDALILGAVATLSPGEISVDGTGTPQIHYSRLVLENLSNYCNNILIKVKQLSWKEVDPK